MNNTYFYHLLKKYCKSLHHQNTLCKSCLNLLEKYQTNTLDKLDHLKYLEVISFSSSCYKKCYYHTVRRVNKLNEMINDEKFL